MKKTLSFFLVFVILLNILGYYGIFFGLQYRNAKRLIQQFDNGNYDMSKAVTVKVPISIPYAVDSKSFERVDGSFEYNGEFYRLIKQTIFKDTLRIVCIRDDRQKEIYKALVSYTETFGDHGNASSSLKSIDFNKDYLPGNTQICSSSEGWQLSLNWKTVAVNSVASFFPSIAHPPEAI